MQEYLMVNQLSFAYENSIETIFETISFQLYPGWTGFVGANGSGKTTLLKLITRELFPDTGSIAFSGNAIYCEQRTDHLPEGCSDFFNSMEKYAFRLKDMLKIEDDWPNRWKTLSHGERKRLQIAVALFSRPTLLAIDEPTNHLDQQAKHILFQALKTFRGIGLLISHDRDFLDNLCNQTLFIDPPGIDIRKCNYSTAFAEREQESRFMMEEHEKAKREVRRLKKRVSQQRSKADQADKLRSKRNIAKKDFDAKLKMDLARLTGKDAIDGRLHSRLKSKLDSAQEHQQATKIKKTFQGGIQIQESGVFQKFPVFIPEFKLSLGDDKTLNIPELMLDSESRIGITGDNGAGKSSFIRYFLGLELISSEKLLYIPQEIDTVTSQQILARIHTLDSAIKGRLMTIIRRLGSDPNRLLESEVPSPGEVRKLMLADGLLNEPVLLVMDEPVNHMDLFSIQHIEAALQEYNGALLLVSHDPVFLENTVSYLWHFTQIEQNKFSIIGKYFENS